MNERFYNLIPLVYKEQDFEQGQPLRALAAVLEQGYDLLHEDIAKLYENWFIELCDQSIIVNIAHQVGIEDLDERDLLKSERRYVANHLAYKRRSGQQKTLNNALQDSTEYKFITRDAYDKMASTWTPADPSHLPVTFLVDDQPAPFDQSSRTADFRNNPPNALHPQALQSATLQTQHGRINLNSVNLSVWTMTSIPVTKVQLARVKGAKGRYHLSPLGFDLKLSNDHGLFNDAHRQDAQPRPVTRANYRDYLPSGQDETQHAPVNFYVFDPQKRRYEALPSGKIQLADLSHWKTNSHHDAAIVFDPDSGRVEILQQTLTGRVYASYAYYANTFFGARAHYTQINIAAEQPILVCGNTAYAGTVATMTEALQQWQQCHSSIVLIDNLIYQDDLAIDLKGKNLKITADNNTQPLVQGKITLTNSASESAEVLIEGLNIEGTIEIGDNIHLTLYKTTLLNESVSLKALDSNESHQQHRQVPLVNSLVSAFICPKESQTTIKDSVVVTHQDQQPQGIVSIESSTVMGDFYCRQVQTIKDSIISGILMIKDPRDAQLSHSYMGGCESALNGQTNQLVIGTEHDHRILHFKASSIDHAQFCRLSYYSAEVILIGAANGEEMGVFNGYRCRLREKKLIERIDKYLPHGLDLQLVSMD